MLSHNLNLALSRRLHRLTGRLCILAHLDVPGRLAWQLLDFSEHYGCCGNDGTVVLSIRLTQSDLGGLIGASRSHVNQVLMAYKRLNLISEDSHHRFTIVDRNALAERCR
jgi:CRP-like cAMP-binding protein